MKVEIDQYSGFCGGVIRAIRQAESFLSEHPSDRLFSLGAIVHNDAELERLRSLGLTTLEYEDLSGMRSAAGATLLIRAHGEPPATYSQAASAGFKIVDCTCPVVLDLQKSIRQAYAKLCAEGKGGRILIFGQIGHAEVLGLMGQADGVVVLQDMPMLLAAIGEGKINLREPVEIFSQTTKSPAEYDEICTCLEEKMAEASGLDVQKFRETGLLRIHNTICTQVATRQNRLSQFAARHDVIIFVSGKASSNGKILCNLCKRVNIRTYHIESASELRDTWFRPDDSVGICGATSTPGWLLEEVAAKVLQIDGNFSNFAPENNQQKK